MTIQFFFRTLMIALGFISLLSWGCYDTKAKTTSQTNLTPIILALGIDLSGTFKSYRPISSRQLRAIAIAIVEKGRDAIIAFSPIGNPTDSTFIRCKIQALPTIDDKAVLSERARQRKQRDTVHQQNLERINVFLARYENITQNINQANTDINGFATKANELLQEPQYKGFRKMLVLYSDGFADVHGEKALICSFQEIPSLSYYSIGWKNESQCQAPNTHVFESFEGFTDFLLTQ